MQPLKCDKAADIIHLIKAIFIQTMPSVCFYHVYFYHLIINEINFHICSNSLATFHKKNAYLKIKVLST